MKKRTLVCLLSAGFLIFVVGFVSSGKNKAISGGTGSYEELVRLFKEWREFQKPRIIGGVPDYSAAAMRKQKEDLPDYQKRLAAIDTTGWPISQQVDYQIVRAEMNGLDFDHRVLRPWSRSPSFYAVITDSEPDVPAREGPEIYGVLDVWRYRFPLSEKGYIEFGAKLRAIPGILDQAKKNLVEEAADLWTLGIRAKKEESLVLANLARDVEKMHPGLVPAIEKARKAVDEFCAWLEKKVGAMETTACGVGIENFNWYMRNVHLTPYTWEQQLTVIEREWERSMAALRLERHRNRNLPELELPATKEEYQRRYDEAVNEFMDFLRRGEIFTVPDYLQLSFFQGGFIPPSARRDFFSRVDYLDPMPLKCHSMHWLDKQRMAHDPHPSPVRSLPLLYNIWDSRAEGLATGMEEMMMTAGLFDKRPRGRELIYVLVAMRCARAMGDLKMHSGEFTLQDAAAYAVEKTPNGWLLPDGDTIWADLRIYLQQPGYGTSYIVGKAQIEKLIADRADQFGQKFTLRRIMDEMLASGMIPVSLIRWEMTGLEDEISKLW